LKTNEKIWLIWVLLVNGESNKNLKHLKNIKTYCHLFWKFNLDYLTIRIHALEQFKYNPVERNMVILSDKLVGIILPIDYFGIYLKI